MDLDELKKIISIFEQAQITELDVEHEGMTIRLKKGSGGEPVQVNMLQPVVQEQAGGPVAAERSDMPGAGLVQVEAPMVGTFYRAPDPDAEPYVDEGDEIGEGQVICIIEAMKLMNEIKAEIAGRVVKVLVETGQPVEFGQPLFLVQHS